MKWTGFWGLKCDIVDSLYPKHPIFRTYWMLMKMTVSLWQSKERNWSLLYHSIYLADLTSWRKPLPLVEGKTPQASGLRKDSFFSAIDINITGGNLYSIHFYIPRVLHSIYHTGVKEIFCLMKEERTMSLPKGLCPSPKIFHVWRFLTHFKFPTGFFKYTFEPLFLSRSKNKIAIMFLPP